MAQMWFAIDQGERGRSWDDRYTVYYKECLARFKDYHAALKLASMDRSASPIESAFPRGEQN
jgi:hypothetical protein